MSRRHRLAFAAAMLAPLLACALLVGCGAQHKPAPPQPTVRTIPRFFSASSVWNAPLPQNAPLDPRSAALARWLTGQVIEGFRHGPSPYIQTVTDSTPVYQVPATQPTISVTLENSQPWARTLAHALEHVPIPAGAQAAAGSDEHLTIWQPSTNRLWELWKARRTGSGWVAEWGGAMDDVSNSPGYFTAQSWPGAESYWGATATSLPMIGGTMLIDELKAGTISHALAMAIPNARADEYAWPAQRTDGTDTDPDALPEGARLRLDPKIDLNKLNLPPMIRMMATAAQRYGIIVRDITHGGVAFFAQSPVPGQASPYSAIFGGIPSYDLLKYFPWSDLQVLRMQVHHGTGSP